MRTRIFSQRKVKNMWLNLSLVKIEVNLPKSAKTLESFSANRKNAFRDTVNSFSSAINESYNTQNHEIEFVFGSEDHSDNKLNGYYARKYDIKDLASIKL